MLPPATPEEVTGLPDAVALIHRFTNTDDRRTFVVHGRRLEANDRLATPAGLERWLREHDLPDPGGATDHTHLARARDLRAALRRALGEEGEVLLDLPVRVRLTARGAEPVALGDPVTVALGRIVAAAVTATADGTWRRLGICPAPDCQWVFYDRSRPGRARWCSPHLCGNRMKTQAYRRRTPEET
ncbi:CGNR zinc finger domain-containing protein [Streptosporangium sp. NPDC050855]|uniref:CGNR zinc finger domain-containing protein n=1 Tax=Streptosporangium sp. NPDC050855 TaxID=3366194 RepID=UPI0037A3C751